MLMYTNTPPKLGVPSDSPNPGSEDYMTRVFPLKQGKIFTSAMTPSMGGDVYHMESDWVCQGPLGSFPQEGGK